jgi:acyl carrier protein
MALLEEVREIIADQLSVPGDTVTESSTLTGDLPADSLDRVEIVMELEEKLGVEIPEEDVEQLTTVGDLVHYLERKLAQSSRE